MRRLYVLPFCAYALFAGCSSEDAKTDGGGTADSATDGASNTDSGKADTGAADSGGQDSGDQDSGTVVDTGVDSGLNGCSDNMFVDKSNGNQQVRTIDPWNNIAVTTPICWTIAQGQSVVWNASPNFAFVGGHPLTPAGGDMPNPVMTTSNGTTVTFTFPNTGNYGFHCPNHPGSMQGVIRVKQ